MPRFVNPNELTITRYLADGFKIVYSCEQYFHHNKFEYPDRPNGYLTNDIAVLKLKDCIDSETTRHLDLLPCPGDMDFREG